MNFPGFVYNNPFGPAGAYPQGAAGAGANIFAPQQPQQAPASNATTMAPAEQTNATASPEQQPSAAAQFAPPQGAATNAAQQPAAANAAPTAAAACATPIERERDTPESEIQAREGHAYQFQELQSHEDANQGRERR